MVSIVIIDVYLAVYNFLQFLFSFFQNSLRELHPLDNLRLVVFHAHFPEQTLVLFTRLLVLALMHHQVLGVENTPPLKQGLVLVSLHWALNSAEVKLIRTTVHLMAQVLLLLVFSDQNGIFCSKRVKLSGA